MRALGRILTQHKTPCKTLDIGAYMHGEYHARIGMVLLYRKKLGERPE